MSFVENFVNPLKSRFFSKKDHPPTKEDILITEAVEFLTNGDGENNVLNLPPSPIKKDATGTSHHGQ